jgi:hypothetical protein
MQLAIKYVLQENSFPDIENQCIRDFVVLKIDFFENIFIITNIIIFKILFLQ